MQEDRGQSSTKSSEALNAAATYVRRLHAVALAGRNVVDVCARLAETSKRTSPNIYEVDADVWAALIAALDQAHAAYDAAPLPA